MTLAQKDGEWVRVALAAILGVAWLWSFAQWLAFPQGARATLFGLLGVAALGLAVCVVPIGRRGLRIAARVLGTLVGVVALVACTLLFLALRNGL